MNDLRDIIKSLKILCKEENLEVQDNMLFDCAVRIFNSKGINSKEKPDEPISDKQKAFLKKQEYEGDIDNLTKKQAHKIISEFFNEENKPKQIKQKVDLPDVEY